MSAMTDSELPDRSADLEQGEPAVGSTPVAGPGDETPVGAAVDAPEDEAVEVAVAIEETGATSDLHARTTALFTAMQAAESPDEAGALRSELVELHLPLAE